MYAKRIRCGWSSGCLSSPSGHKSHERISLIFNEIRNYLNRLKYDAENVQRNTDFRVVEQ